MHTRLLFLNQNVRSLTYDKEAELIRLMLAKGAFACTVQETHFNHDKQYVYGQHLVIGKGGNGRGTGVAIMLSPAAR